MTAGSERGRVKDRLVGLTPSEVALLLACVKQIHSSTHTPPIHPPTHYWAGC